jgi:uncharacterized protein DUF6056
MLFYIVLVCMLASLALYAYLGTFTRYMADDYCSAAALKVDGFWGAQAYWWQNWSGRYSFSFLASLVEMVGLKIVPILPGLAIALWLFSIVWGCLPLLKSLKVSHTIAGGLFLASVALWSTYRSLDDYPQIVFWQTGILTYPVSIILFFLGLGLAVRRSSNPAGLKWWELVLWFGFAFLAGGFSETGVVVQVILLVLLLLIILLTKNKNGKILIPILVTAIIASVLSLLVIALSPGNSVRSAGFQNTPPFIHSFWGSLIETFAFLPGLVGMHTTIFIFGLLAGAFFAYFFISQEIHTRKSSLAIYLAASLLFVLIGIWATAAPAYLLRGGMPPQRVLLSAYFLAACLAIFWGILGALFLRSILPRTSFVAQGMISLGLLALIIIWGVLPFSNSQIKLISPLKNYSSLWDERHQSMLAATLNGESMIVTTDLTSVKSLRELGPRLWLVGDFESSPDHWVNRCAAQYYGVEQIVVK